MFHEFMQTTFIARSMSSRLAAAAKKPSARTLSREVWQ